MTPKPKHVGPVVPADPMRLRELLRELHNNNIQEVFRELRSIGLKDPRMSWWYLWQKEEYTFGSSTNLPFMREMMADRIKRMIGLTKRKIKYTSIPK